MLLSLRLLLITLLTPAFFLLQGFTFDYEVLTECERRHPNDFIARTVCNGKVESEVREKKARECVLKQRWKLISTHKDLLHEFLIENGDEGIGAISERLKAIGYGTTILRSKSDDAPTIVFDKPIACKTEAKLLFNIKFNDDKKIRHLAAWISYPEDFRLYEIYIEEFNWRRSEHKAQIEEATKVRDARIKEENLRKQASTPSVDQGKSAGASDGSADDPKSSTRDAFLLPVALLVILLITGAVSFLFHRSYQSTASRFHKKFWKILPQWLAREKRDENLNHGNSVISQRELQGSIIDRYDYSKFEIEQKARFRAMHVFVQVDVPSNCMKDFLDECTWYKQKIGVYPGIPEQMQILDEIYKSKNSV
jgi:hypothetical protein